MLPQVGEAFTKALNAKGGINGHPVDLILCDDHSDPNQTAACGRIAIQDHVVAAVGYTYNGDQLAPILNKAGIPWIDTSSSSVSENTLPNTFPVTGSFLATLGNGSVAAQACKKPVMMSGQTAGTSFILTLTQLGTRAVGQPTLITKANYITFPPTTTDFGPIVAKALASQPDCLVLPVAPAAAAGIYAAEKETGAHPRIIGDEGNTITDPMTKQYPDQVANAVLVGLISDMTTSPWADYRAALKKYANPSYDYAGIQPQAAWLTMMVATEVAGQVSGPLTAQSLLAQIKKSTHVSLGGKAPAINYAAPFTGLKGAFRNFYTRSLTFYQVKNGAITPLFGGKFYDFTPALEGKTVNLPTFP
jgi:ABC-type branched-subunit amino acid transport system substrate-binding protein